MGSKIGGAFSSLNQVPGTGQSVGDLRKAGYSPQDIQSFGPTRGQQLASSMTPVVSAMQQYSAPPRTESGGGGMIPISETPTVAAPSTDYLTQAMRRNTQAYGQAAPDGGGQSSIDMMSTPTTQAPLKRYPRPGTGLAAFYGG